MVIQNGQEFGLYFHFPYCSQRCPYCDFTLTVGEIPHNQYLQAAINETSLRIEDLSHYGWTPRPLTSLYFGGGTPGLWSTKSLGKYIESCADLFGFDDQIEVTIEANPAEVSLALLHEWRSIGVNRLSLGAQSMRPIALQRLGRDHTPEQVRSVVDWARFVGIERVNVDLIHGLSGETEREALFDLEALLQVSPSHISLYQLTIEPQTSFGARARRGEILIEPEEELLRIYRVLEARLAEARMPLYEVSNAALSGEESRHNLLYWTMGEYLGIGAGAHARVYLPHQEGRSLRALRWQNTRSIKSYLERSLIGDPLSTLEEERGFLDDEALAEESVLVGLRLTEGLRLTADIAARYSSHAQSLIKEGLLLATSSSPQAPHGRWIATYRGREILDHLCYRLILG